MNRSPLRRPDLGPIGRGILFRREVVLSVMFEGPLPRGRQEGLVNFLLAVVPVSTVLFFDRRGLVVCVAMSTLSSPGIRQFLCQYGFSDCHTDLRKTFCSRSRNYAM